MKTNRIIRPLSVALLLSLFVSTSPLVAGPVKPGVERWPIKTSLAPDATPSHPKQIALVDLISLEDPPDVTHNDSRYQSQLIPWWPAKVTEIFIFRSVTAKRPVTAVSSSKCPIRIRRLCQTQACGPNATRSGNS